MRRVAIACLVAGCGRLGFDVQASIAGDGGADSRANDGAGSDAAGGSGLLVQAAPVQSGAGPITVTLPNPSQAGTLLVATIAANSISSLSLPAGWQLNVNFSVNGACVSGIATNTTGTAGQSTFVFSLLAGVPVAVQVTEWAVTTPASSLDGNGLGGGMNPTTQLSIATTFPASAAGELGIATFCEDTTMPTLVNDPAWTSLGITSTTASAPSITSEYKTGLPAGQVTATATSDASAKYAATILTFRP